MFTGYFLSICLPNCFGGEVRKRSRQVAKMADNSEQALTMKIDLVNSESQAEKRWNDRLLDIAEQGLVCPDMWHSVCKLCVESSLLCQCLG